MGSKPREKWLGDFLRCVDYETTDLVIASSREFMKRF